MNPWDEIESMLTNDLHAAVTHAHALGLRARATPFVGASGARFLGVDASRVAMALVCGATTATQVRATRTDDGWVLDGHAGAVPWAQSATALVIAARIETPSPPASPLALFAVDTETRGLTRTAHTSIGSDATSHVHLAEVRVAASSRIDDGVAVTWPAAVHALDLATIVAAAELAGLARGALDAAVAYATTRQQFGAPIATYQALAHRLADMAIESDAAELAVEEAVDSPTPQNASRAKIIANDAAHRVSAGLHQINGGVGFYADQTPPAYYARALALRFEMGDSAIHRTRLA